MILLFKIICTFEMCIRDRNNTYPYYAVANAKENLKGKNMKELLASTQQDDDIWKPATMVNDKRCV